MPLGTDVGLGPGDIVLHGDPAASAIFGPCLLCQTDEWIKMPLGREVGLGPGDIVLDGDLVPPPQKREHRSPLLFSPCLLWPNSRLSQLLLSTC